MTTPTPAETVDRTVQFEHTNNLVPILKHLGVSLLVSTYQAGKLVTVGCHQDRLDLGFTNFEQAMGVAVHPTQVAVGSRRQVWFLRNTPQLAARLDPPGRYDACYLTRSAHFTGAIHGHEMAWVGDELWLLNTLFSCLCVLKPDFSFVPRWKPPFVSALAAEDRCHLNGLGLRDGRPRYVTCLGETDTAGGWRPNKAAGGCILDLADNAVVARGLAMPHSPRFHDGRLWVLDSGRGRLATVDPVSGGVEPFVELPGYTRGLAFHGSVAFIGLSKIRETSVFGGLPIAERRDELRCGIAVVELNQRRMVASLLFHAGVDEIFDVQVLPGVRCPVISGPLPDVDGSQTIWFAPSLDTPGAAGKGSAMPGPGRV